LWLTVVFANMAEAFAEGRGRAQADTLRACARKRWRRCRMARSAPAAELQRGRHRRRRRRRSDPPATATVIEGIATVDESAITGESAPVIRESGGDRSAVTGGTHA